ncbi:hypothetical protein M8J76_014586 [Diaphorina citri]|nr:hypothetical protein M8J76_014586 [Diaphorina citri]
MRLTSHITYAVEKAEKVAAALGRLMPNIGGPGNGKRHILASVVYSTLFYGAPIWQTALKWEKYRAIWDRQRLELNGKLNTTVNVENLVEIMLVNPASWGYVDKFVTSILKQKQVDEQRLEPERCRNN